MMSVTVLTDLITGNLGGTDLSEIQSGALLAEMGRISSDVKLIITFQKVIKCYPPQHTCYGG